MQELKVLILEDELLTIEIVKIYLKKYYDIAFTIYAATTLEEGIAVCLECKPDILLLDINLGEDKSSFTLLEYYISKEEEIIFISSTDSYALRAIKHGACDYLMKPIQPEELVQAVNKALKNIKNKKVLKTFDQLKKESIVTNEQIIAIPSTEKINLVEVNNITYCQADGKYTKFILSDNTQYTSSRNIGVYEHLLLQNQNFFRVHHKYIVNIQAIVSVNKKEGYYCVLKIAKTIPIAKRRQDAFNKFLRL